MSGIPAGIPEDVWAASEKPAFRISLDIEAAQYWDIRPTIARAILAERERCALLTFAAYERKTELCSRIIRRIRSGEGLVR